jgi:hypothetical protein
MRSVAGTAPDAKYKQAAATPSQLVEQFRHALNGVLIKLANDCDGFVEVLVDVAHFP